MAELGLRCILAKSQNRWPDATQLGESGANLVRAARSPAG